MENKIEYCITNIKGMFLQNYQSGTANDWSTFTFDFDRALKVKDLDVINLVNELSVVQESVVKVTTTFEVITNE